MLLLATIRYLQFTWFRRIEHLSFIDQYLFYHKNQDFGLFGGLSKLKFFNAWPPKFRSIFKSTFSFINFNMRHPVLFSFGGQLEVPHKTQTIGVGDLVTDIGKFPEKQKRMEINYIWLLNDFIIFTIDKKFSCLFVCL